MTAPWDERLILSLHEWLMFIVKVGKYTIYDIHGSYGYWQVRRISWDFLVILVLSCRFLICLLENRPNRNCFLESKLSIYTSSPWLLCCTYGVILPSYVGIMRKATIGIPSWTNQNFRECHEGFERRSKRFTFSWSKDEFPWIWQTWMKNCRKFIVPSKKIPWRAFKRTEV